MTQPLRQALREQAVHCEALGSPFTAQLFRLLAVRLGPGTPLTDRLFGWRGDLGASGDSVPLRLAGALHALRLRGDEQLSAAYPPNAPDDESLWQALDAAMRDNAAFIDAFIDSPPQTNEVRRAACLIAAGQFLADRFERPLVLSELGASAGLNLLWDRFALLAQETRFGTADAALTLEPEWRGDPLEGRQTPIVHSRAGVDLNPIDPHDPSQRLRLLAYLWPDQLERKIRTEAAIDAASAARMPPPDRGDAIDWLERRLAAPLPGRTHMVYTATTPKPEISHVL